MEEVKLTMIEDTEVDTKIKKEAFELVVVGRNSDHFLCFKYFIWISSSEYN